MQIIFGESWVPKLVKDNMEAQQTFLPMSNINRSFDWLLRLCFDINSQSSDNFFRQRSCRVDNSGLYEACRRPTSQFDGGDFATYIAVRQRSLGTFWKLKNLPKIVDIEVFSKFDVGSWKQGNDITFKSMLSQYTSIQG